MAEYPDDIMQYMSAVGRNIFFYRQRKGMTMQELGEDVGVDRSAVSRIEAGSNPTLVTLIRIATALDVTLIDLVNSDMKVSDIELEKYTITKKLKRKGNQSNRSEIE
jgi:transcriptional regulator with XRE-family HTH domain